jgi:putative oxidoreductase
VIASGALLTFAGGSILLGLKPKYGLPASAVFLGGVSPLMHDFWRESDPQSRTGEMAHFMKNMALLGAGLALFEVKEPGR